MPISSTRTYVYSISFLILRLLASIAVLSVRSWRVESVHLIIDDDDEDSFFLESLNVRRTRQRRRELHDDNIIWATTDTADDNNNDNKQPNNNNNNNSCKTLRVLLTTNDIASGLNDGFTDYSEIRFGTIQGGTVLLSNPDDETDKIGAYTVLTTFLSPYNYTDSSVDCIGTGSYQFGLGKQISFSSTCASLPYFTITGGQGEYHGATGFVEFMIPDPDKRGYFHDIRVCTH
ncbi:expressed unknown protein [Seminavis robusta]|uniref:Dirigent protein n=1 Tax=Seminavis robusta TaxID=568900 RepID=A0A9N8EZ43_9STRA|nr:expressed unknown protein [Seminavis robusta]|eukprot:Sro2668_g334220.1 n/a (232) ;mRNA; f:7003-7863